MHVNYVLKIKNATTWGFIFNLTGDGLLWKVLAYYIIRWCWEDALQAFEIHLINDKNMPIWHIQCYVSWCPDSLCENDSNFLI